MAWTTMKPRKTPRDFDTFRNPARPRAETLLVQGLVELDHLPADGVVPFRRRRGDLGTADRDLVRCERDGALAHAEDELLVRPDEHFVGTGDVHLVVADFDDLVGRPDLDVLGLGGQLIVA